MDSRFAPPVLPVRTPPILIEAQPNADWPKQKHPAWPPHPVIAHEALDLGAVRPLNTALCRVEDYEMRDEHHKCVEDPGQEWE